MRMPAACMRAAVGRGSPHAAPMIAQLAVEHGVPMLLDDRDFTLLVQMEPKLVLI